MSFILSGSMIRNSCPAGVVARYLCHDLLHLDVIDMMGFLSHPYVKLLHAQCTTVVVYQLELINVFMNSYFHLYSLHHVFIPVPQCYKIICLANSNVLLKIF